MESNIILIGMPASGKSTIGNLLAEQLPSHTLIDTDTLIEKTIGMTIAEYFKKFSENEFRKLEYDTIKMVCTGKNRIISTGGGAFENPDNRATLLKFGKVFYLKSDLDILYYRLSNDSVRPLLQQNNPQEVLKNLLIKREENYLKAHYTIETGNMTKTDIVKTILGSIHATNS